MSNLIGDKRAQNLLNLKLALLSTLSLLYNGTEGYKNVGRGGCVPKNRIIIHVDISIVEIFLFIISYLNV